MKRDITIPFATLGTGYGEWQVSTDALSSDSVVYSFGIGEELSFESGIINLTGCIVHAFDPTPRSLAWARKTVADPRLVLHEFGLAGKDGNVPFCPPLNDQHVSFSMLGNVAATDRAVSLPVRRLSTLVQQLKHTHIDLLKIDIEGAEYEVIEDMESTSIRPTQLLVEFHHRFRNVGLDKTKLAMASLRRMGYLVYAIAESNEEISFIHESGRRTN